MAGIPIVPGASGASGGGGASGASGVAGAIGALTWRGGAPEAVIATGESAQVKFYPPKVPAGAGGVSHVLEMRTRFSNWMSAGIASTSSSGGKTVLTVTGLNAMTQYSFRVTAKATISSVEQTVLSPVSNTITMPGLFLPEGKTGRPGTGYTDAGPAYSVRGYTDADGQERTTQAGNWGVVGDSVSDLHNRTEDNIRDALNWQLGNNGGWWNSSALICGLLSQVPFLGGLIELFDAETVLESILGGLQAFVDGILEFLTCGAYDGTPTFILDAIGDIIDFLVNNPFIAGLKALTEWLGRETGEFFKDVITGVSSLADWICGVLTCQTDVTGSTPLSLISGIQGFIDSVLANPLVQSFLTWGESIGVAVGNFFQDLISGVMGLFEAACSLITTGHLPTTYGSWSPTGIGDMLDDVAAIFGALCDNPLVSGFRFLVESTGRALQDGILGALEFVNQFLAIFGIDANTPAAILEWLQNAVDDLWNTISGLLGGAIGMVGKTIGDLIDMVFDFIGNIPIIGPLVELLTGVVGGALSDLADWVEQVPLIGDIVSRLTNLTPADGVSLDLSQLGAWAKKLLLNDSPIDAGNLIGQIPQALLGMLPVANINVASANLLSQGDFKNAGTVEAASGWSWDPYTNDDALGTGSAKLITNGTNNWLYSRQAVPVAGGDKVKLSARVKTSGYSGASNSIVLAVVPFVGSTAQTPKVFATRGASNGSFVTMTGSGDSNPYVVPAGVTSLIVRVGVTSGSGSGSTVWFDKLDMRKDGLLGQNLVEYLLSAWEGAWGAVFGGSGVGKVWSDFVTALSTLNFTAGQGVSKGDTAQGLGLGIIDSIGKAVFGEGTYNTLSSQVKSALQFLFGKLFGLPTVQDELQSAAIPPLSGSVIQDGEISIDHIPSADIGAAILPGAGSGAMLTRQAGSTSKVTVTSGRNKLPTGFYDTLTNSSPDITALVSGSSYTGTFVVGLDGWYLAEIGLRVDPGWGGGYNLAPLLYKGATPFKVGMDAHQAFGDGSPERYAQSSFIIYLTAGQSVSAGTDAKASYTNILSADTGGIETYFSLSLLNRSYA